MDFTVDRSKWRCGDNGQTAIGSGVTSLLNPEGFMCCLGFVAIQCGVPVKSVLNLGEPQEFTSDVIHLVDGILADQDEGGHSNTKLSDDAIEINDHLALPQTDREMKLSELFKQHGHRLVFTGEPTPSELTTTEVRD